MGLDAQELLEPVFPGLEQEDLAELARVAELRTYPAHTVMCQEGALEDVFYLIVEGHADVSKYLDQETPRRILQRLGPGDFFGEIALVLDSPRTATVDTDAPITVLEIRQEAFMRVLRRSAPMAIRIVLQVTSRLREADQTAIRDLRQKNEKLRQAYRRLELLDQAKADFISVMGHELRTPLAVVMGYVDMLRANSKVQADDGLLVLGEGIAAGAERLNGLINSILDVSRLDDALLELDRSLIRIATLLEEIEVEFHKALTRRRLRFETQGIADLPFIMADGNLLHKAFYHLVMNAIKYTPDGGEIMVSGRVVQENEIEIVVADTGIGIDPQHQALIFEKFYQTGKVELHTSGGTKFMGGGPGLGLAIARGAIEAHGGRVWVESQGYDPQALPGSRFYVRLPVGV